MLFVLFFSPAKIEFRAEAPYPAVLFVVENIEFSARSFHLGDSRVALVLLASIAGKGYCYSI
jgi:hypothetical protein